MQSFHDVKQDAGETRGWGEKGEDLLQQARSINKKSTEHKPGSSVDSPAHTTSYSFPVTPAAAAAAMAVFSLHTSTG